VEDRQRLYLLSFRANALLQETAPWTKIKSGTDKEKADAELTIVAVLEGARIVAVLLAPVTPQLSARIMTQLGLNCTFEVSPALPVQRACC
jgi:methionyl-tRNA synthetase